ncbi:MAG: polysaccharide biosynthesis/export family protein [Bacteroidales bacterium]|nr:polysaccharide biosynthesis/export family protein [Bacteroidales bacterium]
MRGVLKICGIALITVLLFSCRSQKDLIYFQTDDFPSELPDEQVYHYPEGESNLSPNYKLQAHDMLNIQIRSAVDEEATRMFATSGSNSVSNTGTGEYFNSYEVDDNGNVLLPMIGNVRVVGLTVNEARDLIRQKAEEFSKNIIVTCRLVSFKVRVAGEVNHPGIFTFHQSGVDIFDAIISAGDLTYDGRRDKVRVIRKTENEDIVYTLDIRKTSVLRDPKYFLRPGDIVYVEPNRRTKNMTNASRPMSLISSSLSLFSAIVSVVTLVIALGKK